MNESNYKHTCEVCNTKFDAVLKADGTPRARKYIVCGDTCYEIRIGIRNPNTPKGKTPTKGKHYKDCGYCGVSHIRSRPFDRYCSDECHKTLITATKKAYRESESGRSVIRAARLKRKARLRGSSSGHSIDPIKVFERDKWICHLCGAKTLKEKRGTTDDKAPELEHIVSLAHGGTHTWGNVACSCRKCNQAKGANSIGQLGFCFPNVSS